MVERLVAFLQAVAGLPAFWWVSPQNSENKAREPAHTRFEKWNARTRTGISCDVPFSCLSPLVRPPSADGMAQVLFPLSYAAKTYFPLLTSARVAGVVLRALSVASRLTFSAVSSKLSFVNAATKPRMSY